MRGAGESGRTASTPVLSIYGFGCFVTFTWMALAEHFHDLPAAVVAFATGWYLIRLEASADR